MKLNNIVLLALLYLLSCSTKEIVKEDVVAEDEVIEFVIRDVIREITIRDSIYDRHRFPAFYLLPETDLYQQVQRSENWSARQKDSARVKLDTARQHLFLRDSLIPFPPMRRKRIVGMTHLFQTSLYHLDSGFRVVLLNLIQPVKKRVVSSESLKSIPTFKIIYWSEFNKYRDAMTVGELTISRVAFDTDKDKACVYTEFVCGGECGGGYLLFLERRSGKWIVIWRERMWVS